jgi:heptosyltransferase-2
VHFLSKISKSIKYNEQHIRIEIHFDFVLYLFQQNQMPYQYSKKTEFKTFLLELLASIILFPLKMVRKRNNNGITKILLVEPFQMGDVLSLTPLIAPLKSKFPNSKIYVLTKPSSGGVLKYDSRVYGVLTTDFPWSDYGVKTNKLRRIFTMLKYILSVRNKSFDIGIDTRGDIRSQIIMLLAGCKRRVGFLNYLHSNIQIKGRLLTDKVDQSKRMHRYEWNISILMALGFNENELFPISLPSFIPDKLQINNKTNQNNIVVHIGGGWIFKRWEEAKWAELINRISENLNRNIIVISGSGEKDIIERIQALTPKRENVKFKITTFEELIYFVYGCDRFIGLDSGPMNLAVCMNKPVFAIFGPGDSSMWYPINSSSSYIHKKAKFTCNPCLQKECLYPEKNCMMSVEVDDLNSILQTI